MLPHAWGRGALRDSGLSSGKVTQCSPVTKPVVVHFFIVPKILRFLDCFALENWILKLSSILSFKKKDKIKLEFSS